MLDDEVLGTKDLEQFSKSADELTRKLLEITNQVDKLQASLNGVNSSFRNIGKNATKYTNESYVRKVVDDYEKATRKEEERINKETRKKEETKLKKDQHNTLKSVGKIGSTITTVVGSVTAAVATFSKVMKEAVSGISDARWSNSTAAIVEFGKKTEETTVKAKNAFSNILSWAGNGLGIIGNALGSILKKIPGISNIANAMSEDQLEKTLATYKGQAQQSLLGAGASGKLTTKIADFVVSAALSSARKIGGYSSDLSDADVMDTSTYETFFNMYSKLVSEPKSTWFTGYKAMTKGYGFAMTDLSPEENMALMAEAIDELKNLSVEEYNDTIKRWTKMGRVIEKFGKNLYAFDEVLTNDPFSNEDVEDINVTTNDIADKLDEGNDNTKKIGEDIVPPIDDINKASKDTVTVCEEILERLKQMNLNVHVNVPVNVHIPGVSQPETAAPETEDTIKVPDRLLAFAEQLQAGASSATSPAAMLSALGVFQGSGVHSTEPSSDLINTYKEEYKHSLETMLDQMIAYQTILAALSIYDTDNAYIPKNLTTSSADIATIQSLLADVDNVDYAKAIQDGSLLEAISYIQKLTGTYTEGAAAYGKSLDLYQVAAGLQPIYDVLLGGAIAGGSIMALTGGAAIAPFIQSLLSPSTLASAFGGAATGAIGTRKMPTLSALFEEGPEMVLPLNAAGADFLATSLNNLGLSNRLTNNSANVNVNLSGINIADNDREWYEVAHKIHNIIEAEQARQGG